MATKQDPPKKTMKDLLKKISKSGDRASASQSYQSMARGAASAILPKTNALKSALAKGDKSSASQSYQSMARGAASAMLPKLKLKVDSTKKVTMGGNAKPSVMIKKQTTVKPAKPGVISGPYRPNPESKNKPQVKTLPYKIEYKKDKFGKNQVVKPSNPVKLLKNKK